MSDMSTPRPWNMLDNDRRVITSGKDEDGDPSIVAYLAGGQRIASFARSEPSRRTAEANAALIVLAVNAHDDLLAALTEMEQYVVDILTGPVARAAGIRFSDGTPNDPVIQRARAALARAGEP